MVNRYFPAVWSVLSGDALAEQVLSQYAFEVTPTCDLHTTSVNDTYHVRAGSSSYYLRVYVHGWRELHDIEAEVELLNHLHAHELPVAYPIATRDGGYVLPVHAYEGIRYAVLFSAAGGEIREENDHRSYMYGRLTGQIHVCADRIPRMSKRLHIDHGHLLDSPLRSVAPFLAHRPKDCDYLSDISRSLKARVDELLLKESPQYGICHGDLHWTNVHFQDDDAPVLFDFDCFGYGWRAYDLSVFGWHLGGWAWSKAEKANRTRRWNLFVRGYEEHRTLSGSEHEALKVFAPIRQIWRMGLHTAGSERWGRNWAKDEYFDQEIKYIKEWIDHYRVL